MEKRFWIILGVIAVIFVGIFYFGGNKESGNQKGSGPAATNHIKGNTSAKVKLVEYGDFQCPVCASYYPTVEEVVEKYKDKMAFQFRHLPLTQVHQNAFAAARAAEAAGKQGKFWEMYGGLYQSQQSWSQTQSSSAQFTAYAEQLGLDTKKFKTDFSSREVNSVINADIAAFKKTGAPMATPTFFLNDKRLDLKKLSSDKGPDAAKFSQVIEAELKKQNQ